MQGNPRTGRVKWFGLSRDLWLKFSLAAGTNALGFLALIFCSIPSKPLAVLWAFAAQGLGCLMGFIFAIPRAARDGQPDAKSFGDQRRSRFVANTNMEQISDWLTKLLVGAGLVELKSIPRALDNAARYIAAGLGGKPGEFVQAAAAILVFFPVWGFLGAYLITRMFFERAFNEADNNQVDADQH